MEIGFYGSFLGDYGRIQSTHYNRAMQKKSGWERLARRQERFARGQDFVWCFYSSGLSYGTVEQSGFVFCIVFVLCRSVARAFKRQQGTRTHPRSSRETLTRQPRGDRPHNPFLSQTQPTHPRDTPMRGGPHAHPRCRARSTPVVDFNLSLSTAFSPLHCRPTSRSGGVERGAVKEWRRALHRRHHRP